MMVEYVDDWPIMVPKEQEKDLVTRGLAILLQGGNLELGLAQNEKILGIVFGRFRQAVVATDLRVIISKGGWLGADGGRKVSSFEYRSINGIQILHGAPASVPWANHGGTFQILSSSMSSDNSHALNPIVDKIPLFTGVREAVREAPNAVAFRKEHKEEFQNMSNKIREKINSLHLGGDSQSDAKIPEQIKQLSELRDLAIISEEEFEVKKKQLLDRM